MFPFHFVSWSEPHAPLALLLFAGLAILQALDAWTTYMVITAGGREINPVEGAFMRALGTGPGLIVSKLIMLAIVYFAIGVDPLRVSILITIFIVLYIVVVDHNWLQLRLQLKDKK